MEKKKQPAQLLLGPIPAALIGCGNGTENNIITLAWVGVVNSNPPMISAAIRSNRHSFGIIIESGEFTVNIPSAEQVEIVDLCGTLSGKDLNKFDRFNLKPARGLLKKAPMIDECPISMECELEQTLNLGSHTAFIGKVISSYVREDILDDKGKIDFSKCQLLGFCAGSYLATTPLGLSIGYTLKDNIK
ncbi:MAG: flavin reductase family protein [Firmicutes bacterium]|nr:flavin reductase family protein [Bacillota bacterium]